MNVKGASRYALTVAALVLGLSPVVAQSGKGAAGGSAGTPAAVVLPMPSGFAEAAASDVNNAGWISGVALKSADAWPVVWKPRPNGGWSATLLSTTQGRAGFLNDSGQVAGMLMPNGCCSSLPFVATPQGQGFLLEMLPLTRLDGTTADVGDVRGIDNDGTVLGSVDQTTVLWRKGSAGWFVLRYLDRYCPSMPGYRCSYYSLSRNGGWIGGAVNPTTENPGNWEWPALWPVDADGAVGAVIPLETSVLTREAPAGAASATNDAGHAAGWVYRCNPSSPPRTCAETARFWGDSTPIDLIPTTGDASQTAYVGGLNNADEIAGWAVFASRTATERWPAYWKNPAAAPIKLGLPKGGSSSHTSAAGINDLGLVVGRAANASGSQSQAVAWRVR